MWYTVLQLLVAGLKVWHGMAVKARKATVCKSFLINSCDALATAREELQYVGIDHAAAADLILLAAMSRPAGILLHGAQPLWLHCGTSFEACMKQPQQLLSLEYALAGLGSGHESFLRAPGLSAHPFVIMGTSGVMPDDSVTQDWPVMQSTRFSVLGVAGQVSSIIIE